jgi:hypothetical protein
MPLVSALSVSSPTPLAARAVQVEKPRTRELEPGVEEQLFEPRSALAELLYALALTDSQIRHPDERTIP